MAQIDTDAVFKQIKKQNGEAAAHVVRSALLLDVPNIVHILEFAGRNPDDIKQLAPVIREIYKTKTKSTYTSTKEPLDLLSDAGYDAFVVTNLKQQNSIKKYFRPDEELCTFRDPDRYKNYYMIHAVKRGADKIKPLPNPQREDEYGTSVISIQIAKTGGFISIKNRYNHTISNPDATFNNNPDNIILGLSDSLKTYFGVDFNTAKTRIPDNFRIVNDQMVHYDYELNNMYFCTTHYFSGSTITKLNNNDQILFANGFILYITKGNNRVEAPAGNDMEFCNALTAFIRDKKITQSVDKDNNLRTIFVDNKPFMGIHNGVLMFLNAPNLDTVALYNNRRIHIAGDLDYSGVRVLNLYDMDLKNVTSIKMNPNSEQISLGSGINLSGNLDFSGVKKLNLMRADLTNVTNIKFNPNAEMIAVGKNFKLSGDLDFSGVKRLDLNQADLTNVTSIKFNPNAEEIITGGNLKLSGDLDFSGVKHLDLKDADFTNVKNVKFNPNASNINIGKNLKLSGNLDFSGVRRLLLHDADLTNVSHIEFNPNAYSVYLPRTKLSGDLDFKYYDDTTDRFSLNGADLTGVTSVKYDANGEYMNLRGAILAGDWDFSRVKELCLVNADLTRVNSIKFPKDGKTNIAGAKFGGRLDLSNTRNLDLKGIDLTKVTDIKFPKDKDFLNLSEAKLCGDLDFSNIDIVNLELADLRNVNSIKFNPKAHICGNFIKDGFDISTRVTLNGADLRNPKLNPLFNVKDGYVNLCDARLAGDLDFSAVKHLVLNRANLTQVTSIKLPQKLYNEIKGDKCKVNDCDYAYIGDLPKYGIKIKKIGPFEIAKQKVIERFGNMFSNNNDDENAGGR